MPQGGIELSLPRCTTAEDAKRAAGYPERAPRLVVLESPFAGASRWRLVAWWQRRRNVRFARACLRDALLRGEAPIASHLLYTQPGVLKDHVPGQRALGIGAGLAWLSRAQASVVYIDRGITPGMQKGIAAARAAGVPIEFRRLNRGNG